MEEIEDRTMGVLLGLAAGDRIGGPIRMALRVAESLRDQDGFNISDIGIRYLDWWREGAFDTGPTVARVLSLVESGIPFEQASIRVNESLGDMTAGCNPAHRIAPLAMCASLDDSTLDRATVSEARLTHRHPLAGEVAAVVACLCRALIRGSSWSTALEIAANCRSSETRRALENCKSANLSQSGFAPETLRSAIYFLNSSDSFQTALEQSINFAGPANYCPVLVGSIGGARWGLSQIENTVLSHQKDILPHLAAVALDLAKGWRNIDPNSHYA